MIHAVLALLAVTGLAVAMHSSVPVISDDGSVLAQAALFRDGEVGTDLPLVAADPGGHYPPLENSTTADGRAYPYAKHVGLPVAVAALTSLFGSVGGVLFSAWSVWAAGIAAAMIAWRVDRRLAPVVLWSTVLLSPLVFDVNLVVSTGTAAASLGFLVVAVLAARDHPAWWRLVPVAALAFLVPWWRTEGVLAGAAVAAFALGAPALRCVSARRLVPRALREASIGIVALGAAAVGFAADSRLAARMIGSSGASFPSPVDYDPIAGRASAAWVSLFRPFGDDTGPAALVVLIVVLLVLAGAWSLRRGESGRSVVLVAVAAVTSLLYLVMAPGLVTGLVAAVPLVFGGLLLLSRSDVRIPAVSACLVVSGLTVVAVVATSYSQGGGAEWGGRYFHLLLPLLVPAAVVGLARGRSQLAGRGRTVAVVAVAVLAVMPTVLALRVVARLHDGVDNTIEVVLAAVARADAGTEDLPGGPAGDGGTPVVVSTTPTFGRFAWNRIDGMRLLTVTDPEQLDEALAGVAATDVRRVLVLTHDDDAPQGSVVGDWRIVDVDPLDGWELTTLERSAPTG